MAASAPEIHLVVPGLLGPMPAFSSQFSPTGWPQLERVLCRSNRSDSKGTDLVSTLLQLFAVNYDTAENPPTAAYRRIGDGAVADDHYWLQASPVFLRPDQDRLLLFDALDLEFSQTEAEALADLFTSHFADLGWQLESASPTRWYIRLEPAPAIVTYEVSEVFGRNIDQFLPRGVDASRWHALLNEIQMLFFTAPVNSAREASGLAPINGLWFSGGGRIGPTPSASFACAIGDDPLLIGLARSAGIPSLSMTGMPNQFAADGPSLLLYDRLQRPVLQADPFGWVEALSGFDAWLAPLLDQLRAGRIGSLLLYPCNGQQFRLDKRALRRFWRRRQPIEQWLDLNPTGAG